MSKKEEFMKLIYDMTKIEHFSKNMINFLIEALEIALTEERVKSEDFLRQMMKLTNKYIEMSEDNK